MCSSQLNIFIFSLITLVCLAGVFESLPVQRFQNDDNSPVVYRRYIRKKPSPYVGDLYMEEVHEIFETRRRPPQFAIFNDDEIDQLIRCDFEPHLKECEILRKKQETTTPRLPPRPNPTKPVIRPTIRTTTIAPNTTPIKLQPIPTFPTLKPYKPTPAIDTNPTPIYEENDIPTLPPDTEEYTESEEAGLDPISYEEENADDNFEEGYSEVDEENNENTENNEVDAEEGDDFRR